MKNLLSFLFVLFSISVFAQNGDKYFKEKDYQRASLSYEREAPGNASLYLNLAKSYFAMQEFDKAIAALNTYKEKYASADKVYVNKLLALLERQDEKVKVENMGGKVNSANDEYIPRVLQDGKTLYFISESRNGGKGGEDIWYSTLDNEKNWTDPINMSALNSASHEGILAMSPDEKVAVVFGNYTGSFGGGDLFYTVKTNDGWSPPCNMGGAINTGKWESLACIGPDGKTMIYSTDKGDGKGSDLYVTVLSEDGWSAPKNLGNTINSSESDKYPFLSADGKTMYFASDGHFGFGGTDVFMSRRLDETWTNWSEPINMGKYINTLDDDQDLSIPASGKLAYIVRGNTPEGYGEKDIYSFLMPYNMRPEQLFKIYGTVYNEKDSGVQVNIKFIDMATNKEVTKSTSSIENGNYSAALPLNRKYLAVVDMKGYLYYSEVIDLTNPDLYRKKSTFQQKISLQKTRLESIKLELDKLNLLLAEYNQSNSDKIRETFENYEKLAKEYHKAIDEFDALVYRAKFDWMTEDSEDLSLEKDFHLQTAIIGAKFELKNIFFDLGKATLRPESKVELDKLFEILKFSEIEIELGGHTDSIGSDEDNNKLSQDRVNSVRTYLIEKGIGEKRLLAVGYGEKQPVAPNATPEGRQLNRRVEVKILRLEASNEGKDIVSDDDKEKKPTTEVVVVKKGEMLPILQAAARKGGLPSGSNCNNIDYKVIPIKPIPTPVPSKYFWGNWFNKTPFDVKNNVYKTFNAGLTNFSYNSLDDFGGAYIIGVNKKKLNENHIEFYFPKNDVKFGVGYTHLHMITLKEKIGLPMNVIVGVEGKGFYYKDTISDPKVYWHTNLPVGLRFIFPVQKFTLAPEYIFNIGLVRNGELMRESTTNRGLGLTARYSMFHAGFYFHKGKEIDYKQFRLGVSF